MGSNMMIEIIPEHSLASKTMICELSLVCFARPNLDVRVKLAH